MTRGTLIPACGEERTRGRRWSSIGCFALALACLLPTAVAARAAVRGGAAASLSSAAVRVSSPSAASSVAFFPDRLDYPTTDPPASSVPADSVALAPKFQGERVAATAGGAAAVTVWEFGPGSPLLDYGAARHTLALPAGMASARAVAFGPVMRSRRSDLVAVGAGTIAVFPRLSSGPASFGAPVATTLPHGTGQLDIALGDFDGDGNLDAVVADGFPPGADPATVTVVYGNGDGTFSSPSVIDVGNTYETAGVVKVGRLNGDSLPDFVVGDVGCGYGGSNALVFLNTGGRTFGDPMPLWTTSDNCDQAITIGDLDKDGISDIVTANPAGFFNPTNHVAVFLGHGDGSFDETDFPTTVGGSGLAIRDLNGDRHPDVAVVGAGGLDVLPGKAKGRLLAPVNIAVPSGPDYYGAAISVEDSPADLNGDGITDLVVGNGGGITILSGGYVGPSAGPVGGGTTVTITGHGFTSGMAVAFGGVPAASIDVISPSEAVAVTPSIPREQAGAVTVTVGSALTLPGAFRYYVPQIGRLIHTSSSGASGACTASVVESANDDVAVTAGHCVGGDSHFEASFLFAPGFTGYTCPAEITPSDTFSCGDPPPFGLWSAYRVGSNDQWLNNGDHALDYGFLDMNPNSNGQHIAQVVGGGLPIQFHADRGQFWTAYGQAADQVALQEVAGYETDFDAGSPGPDNMSLPQELGGGASGGPWIGGTSGAVSAVNSQIVSGLLLGTYFGSEAKATFQGM
jgi:IPT/TIG domain/FG-GAP-like repeat